MRVEISNFANRKFGDLLFVETGDNGEGYTARFVSATVDEQGVATVNLVPDGDLESVPLDSDSNRILAETADTEWVPVNPDEILISATVRFKHRLTDSVVYPIEPIDTGGEALGADWNITVDISQGHFTTVTFVDEYWTVEQQVAVKPLYPMPTEPGAYSDPNGDIWQFNPNGPWNQAWRNLSKGMSGTADEARPFGPFTPLRPTTGTLNVVEGKGPE